MQSSGLSTEALGTTHHVWVALGSNRDPLNEFRLAVQKLSKKFGPLTLSTVYQNPAEGVMGPDFYNFAAGFCTSISPDALVDELKAIEDACGRQRDPSVSGPRGLDIDLLLYEDFVRNPPERELPHPDILRKPYVLAPLAQIARDYVHPRVGQTLGHLWEQMRTNVSSTAASLQPVVWNLTSPRYDPRPPA